MLEHPQLSVLREGRVGQRQIRHLPVIPAQIALRPAHREAFRINVEAVRFAAMLRQLFPGIAVAGLFIGDGVAVGLLYFRIGIHDHRAAVLSLEFTPPVELSGPVAVQPPVAVVVDFDCGVLQNPVKLVVGQLPGETFRRSRIAAQGFHVLLDRPELHRHLILELPDREVLMNLMPVPGEGQRDRPGFAVKQRLDAVLPGRVEDAYRLRRVAGEILVPFALVEAHPALPGRRH